MPEKTPTQETVTTLILRSWDVDGFIEFNPWTSLAQRLRLRKSGQPELVFNGGEIDDLKAVILEVPRGY